MPIETGLGDAHPSSLTLMSCPLQPLRLHPRDTHVHLEHPLVAALRLRSLAHHIIVILYDFLFVEVYCSIIRSNKSLIVALVDLLGKIGVLTRSIKDTLKVLFDLALYSLNFIALVKLGIVPPLFT